MCFRHFTYLLLAASWLPSTETYAADSGSTALSLGAPTDPVLTADPGQDFWKAVTPLRVDRDTMGNSVDGNSMQVRSRWTRNNLYLLFECQFDELNLKPKPTRERETNGLWNWDVAEAFIGNDFQNINRYKEFEVSPQGEWVDLDIDRDKPNTGAAALSWNSGIRVSARIDPAKKIWYGVMCIPFGAISSETPKSGLQLRVNLYRCARMEPNRLLLNWRPTHAKSFHEPASFGILKLVDIAN